MTTMLAIPAGDEAVIALATELNRFRSLSDVESRILERAMCRKMRSEGCYSVFRRWSATDDAKLLNMRSAGLPGAHMARVLNRTEAAIYGRLRDLKKKERVK